jgi:hypothetical protein
LDGGTLYVEREIVEALGWRGELLVEGVSLRLSGWAPKYFAITKKDTDASSLFRHVRSTGQNSLLTWLRLTDRLAVSTIEGSRDPQVQAVLERLKQKDSE